MKSLLVSIGVLAVFAVSACGSSHSKGDAGTDASGKGGTGNGRGGQAGTGGANGGRGGGGTAGTGGAAGGTTGTGGSAPDAGISCELDGGQCPTGTRCGCGGPGPGIGMCTCHKECNGDNECAANET